MFFPLVSLKIKSLQAYEYTPPISAVALIQRLPCLRFVSWLLCKKFLNVSEKNKPNLLIFYSVLQFVVSLDNRASNKELMEPNVFIRK